MQADSLFSIRSLTPFSSCCHQLWRTESSPLPTTKVYILSMLYIPSWEELPHVAVWDMQSLIPQPNRPLQSTPIAGSARWTLKPEQGQRTMETVISPAQLSTDYLLPSPPTTCPDYRLKRKKKKKNKQTNNQKNKWTTTAKNNSIPTSIFTSKWIKPSQGEYNIVEAWAPAKTQAVRSHL